MPCFFPGTAGALAALLIFQLIFTAALRVNAVIALILEHNHPIFSSDGYFSFADEGLL